MHAVCQVEREECLGGLFYVRDRGYEMSVPLEDSVEIEVFNYFAPDISERKLAKPISNYANQELPYLVEVDMNQEGIGTILREVYTS